MRLRDLQAQLLRVVREESDKKDDEGNFLWHDKEGNVVVRSKINFRTIFAPVEKVADAHGIRFLCPKSFEKNKGPVGTHSVYIFFEGSPHAGRNKRNEEVRWTVVAGETIDDLQLSPSILEEDDEMGAMHRCGWHGFVGNSGVPPGCAA